MPRSLKMAAAMLLLAFVALAGGDRPLRVAHVRHAPRPKSQAAPVNAIGRTSTAAGEINIARVASAASIATYSGDFLGDSAGFTWYVSRHYALKTDLDEATAAESLVLLELAWPQLKAVFGCEPPGSEALRQAIVLGASRASLVGAALDDHMYSFAQGGVTQEGFSCAFAYVGTPYQTRYILLHEAAHLFQYAISGDTRGCHGFFTEGVADLFSSHVYDPARRALTVNVFDRAPIHNHFLNGLAEWRGKNEPPFSVLCADPAPSRGISVVLAAFLQSTPEFEGQWRIFCRQVAECRAGASKALFDKLMDDLYGGPRALDKSFAAWIKGLSPSYHLVGREFDQRGDWLVSAFPASSEAPASLVLPPPSSRRGNFVRDWPCPADESRLPDGAFCHVDVVWDEMPLRSSFASLSLATDDGSAPWVSCVISNAPNGNMAFFEVNGVRDRRASTRRLPAKLTEGVAIEMRETGRGAFAAALKVGDATFAEVDVALPAGMKAGDAARCRPAVSASQPGVRFRSREATVSPGLGTAVLPPGVRFAETKLVDLGGAREKPVEVGTPITAWHVLGPFDARGERTREEAAVREGMPGSPRATFTLGDGSAATWREAVCNKLPLVSAPVVNFGRAFGRLAKDARAYALATVEAEEARDAELVLGVTDAVAVFVNGREVYRDDVRREWADGNLAVPAHLEKGRNEVLLALSHSDGVWLLNASLR